MIGIDTLSTGIISGIIIGALTAYLFNRYSKIKLPTIINFFGGVRFMPILILLPTIFISFIFMIV
jgi:phosphotransferase system  glucose/maltose/N-acetylglucosamine-specific IIC component